MPYDVKQSCWNESYPIMESHFLKIQSLWERMSQWEKYSDFSAGIKI